MGLWMANQRATKKINDLGHYLDSEALFKITFLVVEKSNSMLKQVRNVRLDGIICEKVDVHD